MPAAPSTAAVTLNAPAIWPQSMAPAAEPPISPIW